MVEILITGAGGSIGSLLLSAWKYEHSLVGLYHKESPGREGIQIDIREAAETSKIPFKVDLVVHCAALTGVQDCQKRPDTARQTNVLGTSNIVDYARRVGAYLVYLSTDMVFDGERGNYAESSIPRPLNIYAKTKLAGEQSVLSYEKGIVLRGYFLVPEKGYLHDASKTLRGGGSYTAFSDVINTPILAIQLSEIVISLFKSDFTGLLHVPGPCLSRFQLARLFLEEQGLSVSTLQEGSVSTLHESHLYPRDVSLVSEKTHLANLSLPNLEQFRRLLHDHGK